MKDGVPSDRDGNRDDDERARLDALYERLTLLVLRRREIDEETTEVWNEIYDLESRL